MAIFHDAYLFQPIDFANTLKPVLLTPNEKRVDYVLLRSKAMNLFDQNPNVRQLADNYGAWDKESISRSIPEEQGTQENIAFLVTLILYNEISKSYLQPIGLGENTDLVLRVLVAAGWSRQESNVCVNGHPFYHFAEKWLYGAAEFVPKFWEHLNPSSTAGRAGWVEYKGVEFLGEKLSQTEEQIQSLSWQEDTNTVTRAYQMTKKMFELARINESGLCMISSG